MIAHCTPANDYGVRCTAAFIVDMLRKSNKIRPQFLQFYSVPRRNKFLLKAGQLNFYSFLLSQIKLRKLNFYSFLLVLQFTLPVN